MLKRVICLPFLIGMAQLPVISKAQLTKEKSEKRIVINSNTIRVADLLGVFARETDLEFSFNSKKLSPSKVIAVAHHEQTLSAWLKELETSTGIHVRVKGDHIILQDMPPVVHTAGSDNVSPAASKNNTSKTVERKIKGNNTMAGNTAANGGNLTQGDPAKAADGKKAGNNTIVGNTAANRGNLTQGDPAKAADGKKAENNTKAGNTAASKGNLPKGNAANATGEKKIADNAIAANTPAVKNVKDNGDNTTSAEKVDLSANEGFREKGAAKHDQIITSNKSTAKAGDPGAEVVNGKEDRGDAKRETSLSAVLNEILGKGELRRMPAHEMPAPDKHISLTAHKTVVYPKDTTAIVTAAITDSTRHEAPPLRTVTRIDLGLQGVGISFEVPVSRKYTIEFSGGLGGGYDLSEGSFSYDWGLLNPCAYLSVNGRYYYNRDRRAAKGKSLLLNAGDYFGVRLKYTSPDISDGGSMSDAVLVNIHWGMQRPIGRKWTINGHAGIGWAYNAINSIDPSGGKVYPAAEFKISYALNRKRHL